MRECGSPSSSSLKAYWLDIERLDVGCTLVQDPLLPYRSSPYECVLACSLRHPSLVSFSFFLHHSNIIIKVPKPGASRAFPTTRFTTPILHFSPRVLLSIPVRSPASLCRQNREVSRHPPGFSKSRNTYNDKVDRGIIWSTRRYHPNLRSWENQTWKQPTLETFLKKGSAW